MNVVLRRTQMMDYRLWSIINFVSLVPTAQHSFLPLIQLNHSSPGGEGYRDAPAKSGTLYLFLGWRYIKGEGFREQKYRKKKAKLSFRYLLYGSFQKISNRPKKVMQLF